jgi:hypothetical protein
MYYTNRAMVAAVLSVAAFTTLAPTGSARAADVAPVALKAKPIPDLPFFFVVDDRLSYSYIFKDVDPGAYSKNANGSLDGNQARSVYSFSHFDAWAYGTNVFSISLLKSDHNDPADPCQNAGVLASGATATCAGATEFFGLLRSTFGWNEIFDTKAFRVGPLHNVSFEVGFDAETANTFTAPSKRGFAAGLQFAFDLPYKGYINLAPLAYKAIGHNSFSQCGLFGPGVPGLTCNADGDTSFNTTWAVEINYYMDLGFLPENLQYFAISGRAAWTGPKGGQQAPVPATGVGFLSTATKTELNSEPIRLTFDASKAIWGAKYSHFVETWVAYKYWQNKYGYDHNAAPGVCTVAATGQSTNSCNESTVNAGVTVKF